MEKILKTAVLIDKVLDTMVNTTNTTNTVRYDTLLEHLSKQILYKMWYNDEIPVHYASQMPASISGYYDVLLNENKNTIKHWRSYNLNDDTFLYRINDLYDYKGIKNYFKPKTK